MSIDDMTHEEKLMQIGARLGAREERNAIVKWLRTQGSSDTVLVLAECIEQGEHYDGW